MTEDARRQGMGQEPLNGVAKVDGSDNKAQKTIVTKMAYKIVPDQLSRKNAAKNIRTKGNHRSSQHYMQRLQHLWPALKWVSSPRT
jgi:hypothetical protein